MCSSDVVESLVGCDPDELDDAALTEHVVALVQAREALEAAELRAVGAFEVRKLHRADGAWSTGAWLRTHTTLGRKEANSLERHARMVRSSSALSDALDRFGATKLRTVLRYISFRNTERYEEAEDTILEAVGTLDTDDTAKVMRWWAKELDEGIEPRSWDDNELDIVNGDAGGLLRGEYDTESTAEIAAALDAEAEAIYQAGGTDGVRLSLARRRAMALLEIIRRNLDPAKADTHVPPTVMVSITLDELIKATGRGDLLGSPEYIRSETVRRLACDAKVARVITDGASEILDLGRLVRSAPPKFRRALAVRDGGCTFPGCSRPPSHCQAHHILFWTEHHGPTSLLNLALLCSHHHHLVHEGGWRLSRAPDGSLEFRRPDGRLFEPTPFIAL